jgi:hypothetical protein
MVAGFSKYPLTADNYIGINNTKKAGREWRSGQAGQK